MASPSRSAKGGTPRRTDGHGVCKGRGRDSARHGVNVHASWQKTSRQGTPRLGQQQLASGRINTWDTYTPKLYGTIAKIFILQHGGLAWPSLWLAFW